MTVAAAGGETLHGMGPIAADATGVQGEHETSGDFMGIQWLYSAHRRTGFTLIEAALAIVIVGVGIVAAVQATATCTQQNGQGARMSTAMTLASNIQELMAKLQYVDPKDPGKKFGPQAGETLTGPAPFDDILDFRGQVFSPPIDAARIAHPELSSYTQAVDIVPVNPLKLTQELSVPTSPPTDGYQYDAVRITVRILYGPTNTEVYRLSWLRCSE